MKNTEMGNGTLPTLERCEQLNFLDQIAGAWVPLVKVSQSADCEKDWTVSLDSFKRYLDSFGKCRKAIDPNGLSTRMLRECCPVAEVLTSSKYSLKWMRSGSMRSGRISTADTSVFRSTERGSSLLDIIEDTVDEKYYLSEQAVRRFLSKKDTKIYVLTQ